MGEHVAATNADAYRSIAEALIELSSSRRRIRLYPKGHPMIGEILKKAHEALQKAIAVHGTFTVGIAEGGVAVEDTKLDCRNPALKDFARTFQERGIAAVTFHEGIRGEEILLCHELLSSSETPVGEPFAVLASERGISHIVFMPLDMEAFSFSMDEQRDMEKNESLWDEYMRVLLEGELGDGSIFANLVDMPPEEIARLISSLSDDNAVERSLEGLVRQFSLGRKKRRQLNELITKFLRLLEHMSAEVRERFLNKAALSGFLAAGEIRSMAGELTPELLESMVRICEEQAGAMPDSARLLVEKLNGMAEADPAYYYMPQSDTTVVDDMEFEGKAMRVLEEDPAGQYVDRSYQAMLERIRQGGYTVETDLAAEVVQECSSGFIDAVSTDILFELLTLRSATREEYCAILNRLGDFIGSYVDTGRFQDIASIFLKVSEDSVSGTYAEDAGMMQRNIFGSQSFLHALIESMKVWGRHDRDRVYDLVGVLKEYLLEPLLDALAQEEDISLRRFFLDVLGRLGEEALPGAAARLSDGRWYVVRNMIYLIRECEGVSHLHHIRLLTRHADCRVALEAAKTLLHFRTQDAPSCLKQFLQGRDIFLREHAVRLAGAHKVRELVPLLIEMLDKRDMSAATAVFNSTLVRALAETGDPRVIESFLRVYKSHSFLQRAALEGLKTEIFKHLHFFPPEVVRPLADLGASSKNHEIKKAAERLIASGKKHD